MNCSLLIGWYKLNFICPSLAWVKFLQKQYNHFISSSVNKDLLKFNINVLIQNKFTPGKKNPLKVSFRNDIWEINRYDFYSSSTFDLKETYLFAEKNKYAFDSWLRIFFTLIAVKNSGLLIHSAGFFDKNNTYIFPGVSGAGKSTLIKILEKEYSLSDEINLIYQKDGNFSASSTPFWGELKKGGNKIYTGKVKGIYFLRHGKNCKLEKIVEPEALRKLLKTVLFFYTETETFNKILSLCEQIIQNVPFYTLVFAKSSKKNEILQLIT